ncbi:MAG: hypothetical protein GX667_01915 [Xanthomonadaceae bacterium]|nr:hypothetical protein [Xanthomonadaceae bacterium]
MIKKIMMMVGGLLLVTGCMTNADLPEDQQKSFSGKAKVESVIVKEEGYKEVGVRSAKGEYIVVVVPEETMVFPEQMVRVNKRSSGFGTVTPS